MRFPTRALIPAILCCVAWAQDPKLVFEVASVKPSSPGGRGGMRGGPGTPDPSQITFTNLPLKSVMLRAYGIKAYQLSAPAWLDNEKFDIVAKIPPETTQEQFASMLQNLLVERFGMKVRHETRDLSGYELVIAKGGVKMQESVKATGQPLAAEPPANGTPTVATTKDKDGTTQLAPGRAGAIVFMVAPGHMRYSARLETMAQLVQFSENRTGNPVVDVTGLTGTYDFNLDFASAGQSGPASAASSRPPDTVDDPTPPFIVAIQTLGLKLEPKKIPMDVIVIDHIERVPTEN